MLSIDGKSEVLVRPLAGDSVAVALLTAAMSLTEISFRWDSLYLGAGLGARSLKAKDLWTHEAVPVTGDSYTAAVPKHGVALLRVTSGNFR